MSRPGSRNPAGDVSGPDNRRIRRALLRSLLSGWFSVAPAEVSLPRWMPGERPAIVLAVGEPTPSLSYRIPRSRA